MSSSTPSLCPACRSLSAIVVFLLTGLVILGGDLVLKTWAFKHVASEPVLLDPANPGIEKSPSVVLIPKVLSLQLTTNTGAVFGMAKGNRTLFIIVSLIAIVVIGVMFTRSGARAWASHAFLAMILAGALGNLYDRIVYAQVRDMLKLFPEWGLWPWVFNLADAALMIGVGGILITSWRREVKSAAASTEAP